MFPYANYYFYLQEVRGALSEEVFNSEIVEASFFLRYVTLGKSDLMQPDSLKYAACKIADMYAEEKAKRISGESAVKSENNDGYSVSYITERKDGESLEELTSRKALEIARKYLVNTGLLNRKARCIHDN